MICRRFPLATLFCVALLFVGMDARAQTNARTSTAEDIAIVFFKTGGVVPDFERWARGSSQFKYVAPTRVKDYLSKETQRLSAKWNSYNEKESLIDIQSNVFLTLKTNLDADGNELYWMHISLGRDDSVYFPFTFQDYNIAVVPQKMDTLMIHPLQKQQYDLINTEFGNKGAGTAKIYLQLQPVKSYMEQPYMMDGLEQWALLANVATMSISSRRGGVPYWNYGADWYTSPVTEKLLDLYEDPPSGAAEKPQP